MEYGAFSRESSLRPPHRCRFTSTFLAKWRSSCHERFKPPYLAVARSPPHSASYTRLRVVDDDAMVESVVTDAMLEGRTGMKRERTQEVHVEASTDAARSYRSVLVQEYTFSPRGSTFQREDIRFDLHNLTQLRLTVVPNKRGSGVATLTSLRLYA